MDIAIRDFCATIKDDDCVLIYFSGHGMEDKGKNYLLPIEHIHNPEFDCINLEELLKQLNNCRDNLLNIVILDACRADKENNTWKTKATIAENDHDPKPAFGKALSGHVRLPKKSQFVLIYSADPGTVSFADGPHTNGNSYFTHSLLNHISTPNTKIEDMMKEVSREIKFKSRHRQRPWINLCLHEDFYFQKETKFNAWRQNAIVVAGGNGQGQKLNQLNHPFGNFIDRKKNIFIADYWNHRIVEWKYNAKEGQIIAGGNSHGNRISQLNYPTDVIVDEQNNSIIIADRGNKRVIRWLNQTQQILIDNIFCYGLAMDKNGFLYVSDIAKNEVRRWNMGEYKTEGIVMAGGNGKGNQLNQLYSPTFIFVDEDESVYVSDTDNNRVMKWRKGAKEGIVVAGGNGKGRNWNQLYHPEGIVVDHLGQIYVADSENHRVMRWSEGDEVGKLVLGGNGEGNQLGGPSGLSFDDEGNLYVADWGNHRIINFEINS
ncbi:unnamed protein product [Adineta steineri]|uniref:Peptidase C14 caspase domain-containing protein n=1 Tax=Adineta steineri TaxID=433720 RepID=A0A814YG03_9BILA|nr:unnamed protein product [Adineta steineri]CAF3921673.1 unnamed protein product [Adineta steineri]